MCFGVGPSNGFGHTACFCLLLNLGIAGTEVLVSSDRTSACGHRGFLIFGFASPTWTCDMFVRRLNRVERRYFASEGVFHCVESPL